MNKKARTEEVLNAIVDYGKTNTALAVENHKCFTHLTPEGEANAIYCEAARKAFKEWNNAGLRLNDALVNLFL